MTESEIRKAFIAIHDMLDDLEHMVGTVGSTQRYQPPEAHPLARLRQIIQLPYKKRWKKVEK